MEYVKTSSTTLFGTFLMALFLCMLAGNSEVCGQVSIAPTSVFMNDRSPYASVIVTNGSENAQEISITFRFGYSVSDQEGNISMRYDDSTEQEESFTEHLNAFPRNFILQPNQRQTVRLAARGHGNKPDGTYWARINILASPLSPALETTSANAVSARINMNFEQIIPAFFKKGTTTTGLQIHSIDFLQEDSEGAFLLDLEREGNSPYMGSTLVQITDNNGRQVMEQVYNLSAYFDLRRRYEFDLSEFSSGSYTALFTFRTQRRDVSRSDLVQAESTQHSIKFTVD